jgi:phosphate/sulfate permease
VLVVITALAFDFTNGFHDTGNAMATSIATGALPPRVAVALSGLLNLIGAFLSLAVAATIASGLVDTQEVTLQVVAAGLAGGIIWNLLTWLFGIPSSSSHALIGGVIGSTLAAAGSSAVLWKGLVSKVVIPAALSPVIAALVAAVGTWLLYRISRSLTRGARNHGFRVGQVGSAHMVSLAHGTNDAQKTMGIITLALIANGTLPTGAQAPFWVILSCALAISIGTYLGGWRVIRTLGKGLVEIESPQGMAAESSSAALILLSASRSQPPSVFGADELIEPRYRLAPRHRDRIAPGVTPGHPEPIQRLVAQPENIRGFVAEQITWVLIPMVTIGEGSAHPVHAAPTVGMEQSPSEFSRISSHDNLLPSRQLDFPLMLASGSVLRK